MLKTSYVSMQERLKYQECYENTNCKFDIHKKCFECSYNVNEELWAAFWNESMRKLENEW